jgi:trehalose/maltose transport system permease protein
MSRRTRRRLGQAALYGVAAVVLLYTLFPFVWAISTSLKSGSAIFDTALIPADPRWDNYIEVFREQPFGLNILNSVIVATSTVLLSLALGLTAAHALGRVNFRGRALLLVTVLGVSMFPQVAVLSGLFELVRWLGLYNTLAALTFSYLIFTLPFTVWVLTTFVRALPIELEEAAMIDGASSWMALTRVFLPLLAPAMVTTGLLAFIAAWNEFLFALTFTLTDDRRTVPVAIALISGASAFEVPWGRIMAASVTVTVPLNVLVLVFQRRIVAGLTAGAVKG